MNNGISAICTNFSLSKNKLLAENFQIVNGAQTVGSIAKSKPNASVDVLFRLTIGEATKKDKGFNNKIIQYNNTQNIVKVSDFRSNDPIQLDIKRKFEGNKKFGNNLLLQYESKRGLTKKKSGYQVLKLEDLAKIRYAFLHEPTKIFSDPKALWTLKEDGGCYEKSFGVPSENDSSNYEIVDFWEESIFEEAKAAIVLSRVIESNIKNQVKENELERLHTRFRYHYLSLMAEEFRNQNLPISAINNYNTTFKSFFESNFPEVSKEIMSFIQDIKDADKRVYSTLSSGIDYKKLLSRWMTKTNVSKNIKL